MDRRSFLHSAAGALAALPIVRGRRGFPHAAPLEALAGPRPSAAQLAWQRNELALFFHVGVNTFTDREWGDGQEDPSIFAPTGLDARQWTRAARATGARTVILTAKHHDGFCLWPTATTTHSVASSPWRGGQGDVVRELADACRADGLELGVYLSPWDRNNPAYGDSPRYNDLYITQLTELLTRYGAIAEVWFDGANGEGPNGKRQAYDWPRVWSTVRRFQPNAVIFSDAGPDVRWCGNERGVAGDPNWSTVDPSIVTVPGASGPGVIDALQHGDPEGTVWRPAEADVSIRPGWFHHAAEDARVRSVENLIDLYCSSVGRNAKLLLNVPPTRAGLLHATDVARLSAFRAGLDTLFEHDLADGARVTRRATGPRTADIDVELARPVRVSVARLSEDIAAGQSIARYSLVGMTDGRAPSVLSRGATIGCAKIDRVTPTRVSGIRLSVEGAAASPGAIRIRLYDAPS